MLKLEFFPVFFWKNGESSTIKSGNLVGRAEQLELVHTNPEINPRPCNEEL